PPDELARQAESVLREAGGAPGHIFNLGHGIWPQTDPDALARLVDIVHDRSARGGVHA
ncbi:uroporphyrinogen decarboxylase, partial [mine drainage metagenome]